ncbi:kinase-like domain-containing protein [Mycena crocata]|nr:kinase-like domain-containing protein [Mycena crocata]
MDLAVEGDFHPELLASEYFWINHRDWLKEQGYLLRSRYQEGWQPSWTANKKSKRDCEDEWTHSRGNVLDATRIQDGKFVMLKWLRKDEDRFEVEVGTWFSAEPQRSDPTNHCVPIYDVLQPPDPEMQIIVMPLLIRYDQTRFDTVGETVSFFRQILEGMKYMHAKNVVHRDCTSHNIMMDPSPIFPTPFHPADPTMKRDFSGRTAPLGRTMHPVKYYITDFGFSRRYEAKERPPLETPVIAADKTAPEFQADALEKCDPFPVDVYYIGNLIREEFVLGNKNTGPKAEFAFMEPLVADMVNSDPKRRPSMDEAVDRFEVIVRGLSSWTLRGRVPQDNDSYGIFDIISHWVRRLRLVVRRYPPVPMP